MLLPAADDCVGPHAEVRDPSLDSIVNNRRSKRTNLVSHAVLVEDKQIIHLHLLISEKVDGEGADSVFALGRWPDLQLPGKIKATRIELARISKPQSCRPIV